ncbi:MAG: winged helix-turn-helix domain-containing protein [Candidatus Bathyarchaeota archaeon]|nr:winged helix-turn-helix domain-containing protein [Candidatus Bathyarchaeota archaeon]MDH5494665.1 winged helix-turn-helix domain-containing protein [Candidatus Bathyarchaeota archaeon]
MDEQSRYHTLLRDPARRKIIEILGEQEKIGFKGLKQMLGLGVGTVYYHLDMLSDYLTQDKRRKYKLNDRGRLLYKSLKGVSVPSTLQLGETFSHRLAKWLFLSPIFAKTTQPLRLLPLSLVVLVLGALGSAFASSQSLLFFYSSFTAYQFETTALLYLFNWVSLFLFSDLVIYLFFRRIGGDLQLFVCLGIASFPTALFPYIYMFLSYEIARYFLLVLIIWSVMLLSSAYSFSKGLRIDKSIVMSLLVLYLNTAVLLATGQLS